MATFSERKGLKPVKQVIQTDSMSDELRNSLWNALYVSVWNKNGFVYSRSGGGTGAIEQYSAELWFHYFKLPIDERPGYEWADRGGRIFKLVRDHFFSASWNEAYDFLEFTVRALKDTNPGLPDLINKVLERELAGYRFVRSRIVDITSEQEIQTLEDAIGDRTFAPVSRHLERALELLADRKAPDYRNSIKESVSAVEAMARIVAGVPRATLGEALKVLEKKNKLHAALKDGFSKLYGYTSDESGIRHAMLEEPNLSQADARYFLLSCTSFVNYLKANLE